MAYKILHGRIIKVGNNHARTVLPEGMAGVSLRHPGAKKAKNGQVVSPRSRPRAPRRRSASRRGSTTLSAGACPSTRPRSPSSTSSYAGSGSSGRWFRPRNHRDQPPSDDRATATRTTSEWFSAYYERTAFTK